VHGYRALWSRETLKASAFEYVRVSRWMRPWPAGRVGDEAKVLAADRAWCVLNLRLANPAYLVDINRIGELNFIANGSGVRVGAWPQRDVERSSCRSGQSALALPSSVWPRRHRNRGPLEAAWPR